jgi:hypothetical protein
MTETVLFKDSYHKMGWNLNVVKNNEIVITTSLYNEFGKIVETKSFRTTQSEDLKSLKEYIELFLDNPKKNLQKIQAIRSS